MGEKTNIEWSDSTTNPSSGCDGCELWNEVIKACYAGNLHEKRLYPGFRDTRPELYAPTFDEVRMIPGRMKQAAAWSDLRGKERAHKPWLSGLPRVIFVGDMGDFMSRAVTDDYFKTEILGNITSKAGSRHFWMLLTKRPGRLANISESLGGLPDNVMAMTTITTQKTADARIPELLRIKCRWRGLSAESLLEEIKIKQWALGSHHDANCNPFISLAICGGESGANARECNLQWLRSFVRQCKDANTACFVKQWGSNPVQFEYSGDWAIRPEDKRAFRKSVKLNHPKGGDPEEWPEDIRVRQFPEVSR